MKLSVLLADYLPEFGVTIKNEKEFEKVKIAGLSIEWENGADICPDELYNNSIKLNLSLFELFV